MLRCEAVWGCRDRVLVPGDSGNSVPQLPGVSRCPSQGKGGSGWLWDHELLAESCPHDVPARNLGFCPFWYCDLLSVSWQMRNHWRFIAAPELIWAKLLCVPHFISPLLHPFFAFLLCFCGQCWQLILKFHNSHDLLAGCCELQTIDNKLV